MLTLLTNARDKAPERSAGTPFPEEAALAAYLLCLPLVTFVAVTLAQGPPVALRPADGARPVSRCGFAVTALGRNASLAALAVLVISHGFLR